MREWNELTDQEQVYLYWEYCASLGNESDISFSDFDEMMQGFILE